MKNYLHAPNKKLSLILSAVAFASFWFIACYKPYLLYIGRELYPFCQTAAECSDPIKFPFHLALKFMWLMMYLVLALFVSLAIKNFSNRVRLGHDQYQIVQKEQEVMRLLEEQKNIEAAAIENNIVCTKCKCKTCTDPEPKKSDSTLWFFIPFLIIFAFIF